MSSSSYSSSRISLPHKNVTHEKPFSIERRPKLLKDFLNDTSDSCSSSGFKSFPRHQPIDSTIRNPNDPKPNPKTMSTFQALINMVKNIQFTTVKSPTFLPRSLSRRLSRKESKPKKEVKLSVRVKDILRWTSFRDVAEEISPPLDFSPSPNYHTITTTESVDSFCNSTNNSSSFSWCESDFTAEFLPSWSGKIYHEKELEVGKKNLPHVGVDCVEETTPLDLARDPQDEDISLYDEDEQQSPVSVFDFQFRENEEPFSTFDQSLANVERTRHNLIEKIKEFESLSNLESLNLEKWRSDIDDTEEEYDDDELECSDYNGEANEEERARELLVYVKATSGSTKASRGGEEDQLLFEFFRDELRALKNNQSCANYGEYNSEIVSQARAWMSGDYCNAFEYGVEHYNKEAYVRGMNKVVNWSKFEVEQEDLALEIGDGIVGDLLDELLIDIFGEIKTC